MKKRFNLILIFTLIILTFSIVASAAHHQDGKIIGLSANSSYEYIYVTLENYNNSLDEIDVTNSTFVSAVSDANGVISGINDAGIIYIRNKNNHSESYFVYAEGEPLERSVISEEVLPESYTEKTPFRFVQGKWMGYYAICPIKGLLTTNDNHVSTTTIKSVYEDINEDGVLEDSLKKTVKENIEGAYFAYAYLPKEIIPIEELYTLTFDVGYYQSGLNISSESSSALKTKLVLYTLQENGIVTKNTWTGVTEHPNSNSSWNLGTNTVRHTVPISSYFSGVSGYVLGFEIYPYGELPDDVTFFSAQPKADGSFTGAKYSVTFVPSGYTTKWLNDRTVLPVQYNGANTAYINGYGNGLFVPEGKITRAEISSILSKLILKDSSPIGYVSKFNDMTPGDWYYEAVAYLETLGVFDYITDDSFNPNEKITRGELTKILSYLVEESNLSADLPFTDVKGHVFEDSIKLLYELEAVNGYGDNTFRPDSLITRAETVTIINRLINLTVNDDTVIKNLTPNKFSDISGHWAESQVLMASNNNVKTKFHIEAKKALSEDEDYIYFETKLTKVKISKKYAKVVEFIDTKTSKNVLASSLSPFFATVTSNRGMIISPMFAEIVDKRLHIVFADGTEAYFVIDVYDNFFTVTLDSDIPVGISEIAFAYFGVNTEFSMNDESSYRLSNVSMDTRLILSYAPGGSTSRTVGHTISKFGDVIGAKIGIAFSEYGGQVDGVHRSILKEITDKIDQSKGISSKAGGAYALDKTELFYDYVIINGFNSKNAENYAYLAEMFDVEILDLHFGSETFTTGDFNFVTGSEEFTDGKAFKEMVLDPISEYGREIAIHSYAQGISSGAKSIVTDPKWQKDLHYKNTYTLKGDISSSDKTLNTYENASGYQVDATAMPSASTYGTSQYLLIDQEIIRVAQGKGTESGFIEVERGCLKTVAAAHKDNAEIRHLTCLHTVFHAIPGSDLYYYIADQHAKAYNDTGAIMIYLDCQDAINSLVTDPNEQYYYMAEFVRRIVEGCNTDPLIESSNNGIWMWNAAGKNISTDVANKAIKRQKKGHYEAYGSVSDKSYLTCNLGWFGFDTSSNTEYRNVYAKLLFRDDMDYMGSVAIASNFAMTPRGLSDNTEQRFLDNYNYYGVYSKLRKGGYFHDDVRKEIKNGSYEYRLIKLDDVYAFEEMYYVEKKVDHVTTTAERTGTASSAFEAHTPFIRIEQKFSTLKTSSTTLLELDETLDISSVVGTKNISVTDIEGSRCLGVNVYGNGKDGAILISLKALDSSGRYDYFIPTNHTGWKEFYLMEVDNGEYDSTYSFEQASLNWTNKITYSHDISLDKVNTVIIGTSGDVSGVKINDILMYPHSDAPAKNPSVTIGGSTITFEAEIHSGDFIEYYPEKNAAYLNYFENVYNAETGKWEKNVAHVKAITFIGSVTVPKGDFSFEYNAEALTNAPLRARVKLGLRGKTIQNPEGFTPPEIDMGNATLDIIER